MPAPAFRPFPHPASYAVYAALFGLLAVLLSTKISAVIYGLRQTVREARRLGPYTLVEKIGEGGMGAVYRASHALLRRPTAIKILPPQRAGEMDLARFEREVQMTSQLTSPHTVSVYDYGRTPDGLFYYAMEFLDGIDLEELVRRDGPMPPARVVHVLRQVCEALGEAHRAGLIHRDVKPANILLCERGGRFDVAKVVDFGLVKSVAGGNPGVTVENMAPGTPHYMAPEALTSPDRIDARSDVYSLGATAYFLLTGRPVFEGALAEVLAQLLKDPPPSPSARLGRSLPAGIDAVILAALAKKPEDRPESVEAFHAALLAAADGAGWSAREAEAWWRGRGAEIKSARSGGRASKAAGSPRTLDIAREAGSRERLERDDDPGRQVSGQDPLVRAGDGHDRAAGAPGVANSLHAKPSGGSPTPDANPRASMRAPSPGVRNALRPMARRGREVALRAGSPPCRRIRRRDRPRCRGEGPRSRSGTRPAASGSRCRARSAVGRSASGTRASSGTRVQSNSNAQCGDASQPARRP